MSRREPRSRVYQEYRQPKGKHPGTPNITITAGSLLLKSPIISALGSLPMPFVSHSSYHPLPTSPGEAAAGGRKVTGVGGSGERVRHERGRHDTRRRNRAATTVNAPRSCLRVPVTHILTLSGRSLQSQPFHRESFYVTGTPRPFATHGRTHHNSPITHLPTYLHPSTHPFRSPSSLSQPSSHGRDRS